MLQGMPCLPIARLCSLLGLGLLLLTACGQQRVDLLEVQRVAPAELSPGTTVAVSGTGFPAGRTGTLRLHGRTLRAGQTAKPVDVAFPTRALSGDHAEAVVESDALAALGHAGTFVGSAELVFASNVDPDVVVTGQLQDLTLEVLSSETGASIPRTELRKRARKLADYLGLSVNESADCSHGLQVSGTAHGSRAARAGITEGDRIVAVSGLRVHSLSDLAPVPGAESVVLRVARHSYATPVDVRLPIASLSVPTLSDTHTPAAWIVIALLWFVAFHGPFSSPTLWLARVQSRIRHGEPLLALGLWDDQPRVRAASNSPRRPSPRHPARLLADVAVPLIVIVLLLSVALLQPLFGLRFNSLQVYLGMAGFLLWLSLAQGDAAFGERLRNARQALGQLAVLMLIVGCACALSGTRSLSGIVAAQGSLPQRWGLFEQPALFLLFPVFVLVESTPPQVKLGSGPWGRGLAYAALVFGRLLLCGMGAAVFLGGWASHEWYFLGPMKAQLVGAALFVLKTFAMALLLHTARSIALGRQRSRGLVPTLLLSAAVTTALWVFLGAGQEVRLFSGFVLSTAAALVTVTAGLRVLRSDAPMGAAPMHPAPFR